SDRLPSAGPAPAPGSTSSGPAGGAVAAEAERDAGAEAGDRAVEARQVRVEIRTVAADGEGQRAAEPEPDLAAVGRQLVLPVRDLRGDRPVVEGAGLAEDAQLGSVAEP